MKNNSSDSLVMQLPLSQDMVALVDTIDNDLAEFKWTLKGSHGINYAKRCDENRKTLSLHRVIMARIIGRKLERYEFVDHINHDGLDNRRDNLRISSVAQNSQNRRQPISNSSGYKGVRWHKKDKLWRASISANGKAYHLGSFQTPEIAAQAYNEAAIKYHGEFAYLNIIPDDTALISGGDK